MQIATHLTQLLLSRFLVNIQNLINLDRDSASSNAVATRTLRSTFSAADDMLCGSHTVCHLGDHFTLDKLEKFMAAWTRMMNQEHIKKRWARLMGEPAKSFSEVRWWALAEMEMQIAMKYTLMLQLLRELRDAGIAPSLVATMMEIEQSHPLELKLQFAAMLDMRLVVSTTYDLEGDGLAILLAYAKGEALRALGRNLNAAGTLANVEAVLRNTTSIMTGSTIRKVFPGHGLCEGAVISQDIADSTLYPGQERTVYTIKYHSDGAEEDLEEEEIRPLLVVQDRPERAAIVNSLLPGFTYWENRITGNCYANFNFEHTYLIWKLAQAFDPSWAATSLTQAIVQELSAIVPIGVHRLTPGLVRELPAYLLAATTCTGFDRGDIPAFTAGVLAWWKMNHPQFPTWALAARIVFALLPSSAPCERVFSLVESMFGHDQLSSLADMLQGSVMLRYNDRVVG